MRAISLRTARSRPWLSSWPVAAWNRRLNSSSLASASLLSSSSSVASRRSTAVKPLAITPQLPHGSRTFALASRASGACASASGLNSLAGDKFALHRELVHGPAKGLPGHLLRHPGQLEHDPPGLDVGDPPLRRALTRAHPGLGGLLGQRAVRVDVDPHLPATPDVPGHRNSSGLDLPVGHVGVLQRLDAVLAEGHAGAAGGLAVPVRPVLFAMLGPARDEHSSALLARGGRNLGGGGGTRGSVVGPRPLAAAAAPGRRTVPVSVRAAGVPVTALTRAQRGLEGLALGPGGRRVAAVDPHLDADPAERRACLVEAVVDVGAQGVQRHAALAVEL